MVILVTSDFKVDFKPQVVSLFANEINSPKKNIIGSFVGPPGDQHGFFPLGDNFRRFPLIRR